MLKKQYDSKNIVMYSSFKKIESRLTFDNFSIKYVVNGKELYKLKGYDYLLNGGQYLLCNAHCEGKVLIDSKQMVDGLCIDISKEVISEVMSSYAEPDTNISDLTLDTFFHTEEFMEQQFDSQYTKLGHSLSQIGALLAANPNDNHKFNNEFYYNLAEGIIEDYIPVIKKLQSVRSLKSETRKDLVRKLSRGKDFIDQNFLYDIEIEKVAIESNISQYHFYRLFKCVYGISPYQYIKQKRMLKANELIKKNHWTLNQLAIEVGYSDIFSFSKAYKQFFGCSPSHHQL